MKWRQAARCLLLASGTILLAAATAAGQLRSQRLAEARQLVSEALQREIYGLQQERDALLRQAEQLLPDYAPARWHQGLVKFGRAWLRPEEMPQRLAEDPRWDRYQHRRASMSDTVADHWELAQWCSKEHMEPQRRAHLYRILQLDPEHEGARRALGFRRVASAWLSPEDAARLEQEERWEQRALQQWGERVRGLTREVHHNSLERRETARARLAAMDQVEAVPALERYACRASETSAALAVQAMARINDPHASIALARQAVLAPWPRVRQQAAQALAGRDRYEYVPYLISQMYQPAQSEVELEVGEQVRVRRVIEREGQQERQRLVLDTVLQRVSVPGGDRSDTLQRALLLASRITLAQELAVAQENFRTQQLNARIAEVLRTATGEQLDDQPESWWQWWDQHNELYGPRQKSTRQLQDYTQLAVTDRTPSFFSGGPYQPECLAAGTPVWTAQGLVPVEQVQVGDLVLAQDPDTGELAYPAVLGRTIRPEGPIFAVVVAGQTIRCSGGHLFWVSGRGWVKARELQSGDILHGLRGGVPVSEVLGLEDPERTYNLVVDQFHTYFAGPLPLLQHDVTVRQAVRTTVPGLDEP